MSPLSSNDSYTDDETASRAEAALRRALNTPPQPKHGKARESNSDEASHASATVLAPKPQSVRVEAQRQRRKRERAVPKQADGAV